VKYEQFNKVNSQSQPVWLHEGWYDEKFAGTQVRVSGDMF